MSAEAFPTVLSCDVRVSPDGSRAEYAHGGTGLPRWVNPDGTIYRGDEPGWATCYQYAEGVVRIAATAVRGDVTTGLTGDHHDKRDQAAALLDAVAELVRLLALDAAYDGCLTEDRWTGAMEQVQAMSRTAVSPPL